jgi:hypothetical protein
MRRFTDAEGRNWDVTIGRESWGALYALFIPVGSRTEPVRQALLQASDHIAAERELDAMDEAALRALLQRSVPRET